MTVFCDPAGPFPSPAGIGQGIALSAAALGGVPPTSAACPAGSIAIGGFCPNPDPEWPLIGTFIAPGPGGFFVCDYTSNPLTGVGAAMGMTAGSGGIPIIDACVVCAP